MSTKVCRLTTSRQAEAAGVRLFNQIDRRVGKYIGSAESSMLRKQAMRNAVGMLEVLKEMYQIDLKLHSI
jgi:hypothetical protein